MISDGTLRKMMHTGHLQVRYGNESGRTVRHRQIQPASIDVTLDHLLKEWWEYDQEAGRLVLVRTEQVGRLDLQPKGFVLGSTYEWVGLPSNVLMKVEGKSSLARLGVEIECAGYADPGFRGNITLEITNHHPCRTIPLQAGMPIAQFRFEYTDTDVERPYGHPDLNSHYQGQKEVTPSWMA